MVLGITPPGLLVPFVASKFSSTNNYPLVFVAKGTGYDRLVRGWQNQMISMMILSSEKELLDRKLSEITQFLTQILPSLTQTKIEPDKLRMYESCAGNLVNNSGKVVARLLSTGKYISERLKIINDDQEYLFIGFVEIYLSDLVGKD